MIGLSLGLTAAKSGPLVIDLLRGDMPGSFTRPTPGTALNKAGAVIHFEADQPRRTDRGVLFEPGAINAQMLSENVDGWHNEGATITPNVAVAPDGTTTADRIRLHGPGVAYIYRVSDPIEEGVPITCSFWAKTVGASQVVGLRSGSSGVTATRSVTSSWQRFEWTITSTSTTEVFQITNNSLVSGVAALVDLHVWGFQVEHGSKATSYIPTPDHVGSSREADSIWANLPVQSYRDVTFVWDTGELTQSFEEMGFQYSFDLTAESWPWIGRYLQKIVIRR